MKKTIRETIENVLRGEEPVNQTCVCACCFFKRQAAETDSVLVRNSLLRQAHYHDVIRVNAAGVASAIAEGAEEASENLKDMLRSAGFSADANLVEVYMDCSKKLKEACELLSKDMESREKERDDKASSEEAAKTN